MLNEQLTLKQVLESPAFAPVAKYAIFNYDITEQPFYTMTLKQLKEEHVCGDIPRGLELVSKALATGDCLFPVYTEDECADDPAKKDVNLLWLPSADPKADARPYIFLVPGGGFWNVWSLTEGWPVADHFNKRGYHVFVLTYRCNGVRGVIPQEMRDFERAFRFIRENEKKFHVQWDRYITNGYSAGGYLICLWATAQYGARSFGLPNPVAMMPVYPFTSWMIELDEGEFDPEIKLLDCTYDEAVESAYEIREHVEGFPPCTIALSEKDGLVPPENSHLLWEALGNAGIPVRMEAGEEGDHGFAEASGMCMEGWPERALDWVE